MWCTESGLSLLLLLLPCLGASHVWCTESGLLLLLPCAGVIHVWCTERGLLLLLLSLLLLVAGRGCLILHWSLLWCASFDQDLRQQLAHHSCIHVVEGLALGRKMACPHVANVGVLNSLGGPLFDQHQMTP